MKVIYIAGPFRGATPWQVEQNIRRAEALSLEVWKIGAAALCPHTNTRHFDGELPDDIWLDGAMELLRRCDAVLLTPDWAKSRGAQAERAEAVRLGLPVFSAPDLVLLWLREVAGT